MRFLSKLAATGTVLLANLFAAMPALADPTGLWTPGNQESRYEITRCGQQNGFLCGKLVWIQEDKKDARNTRYLDTYMFENARPSGENRWRTTVTLEGFNVDGTLTQTGPDSLRVEACAIFVLCETIELSRVQ